MPNGCIDSTAKAMFTGGDILLLAAGTFGESASDRHTIEISTLFTDDMFSQSWQVWKLWSNIYFSKYVNIIIPT